MEILVGALAAWGLIMLVWTGMGALLLPLRREPPVTVAIHCRGAARWLERCVRGVLWLRGSGLLWGAVVILDEGMSGEARDRAQRLARDHGVLLLSRDDWKEWMGRTDAGNDSRNRDGGSVPE